MDSVNATLNGEPSTRAPTDSICIVLIVFCVGISKAPPILIACIVQFVVIYIVPFEVHIEKLDNIANA